MRVLLALMVSVWTCAAAQSETFIFQGSTTFTHRIMEPYQVAIEATSGDTLTVVPNKSSLGLLALFDKRADFAMISGPLANEIESLRRVHPELPYDQLRAFNIWNTRMAFSVNMQNPIRQLTDDKMRAILLGTIINWREVGGQDLRIRIVKVRGGGGVQASIEAALLDGKKLAAPNPIEVQISSQVVKVVEQLPEALGLSQLSIVKKSETAELKLERSVEQNLDLVTFGNPTPEMHKVVDVTHRIVTMALEQ